MTKKFLKPVLALILLVLCYSCAPSAPSGTHNTGRKKQAKEAMTTQQTEPVTVKVFLENTGSMFGYYSQGNSFEKSIAALVTSTQVSGFASIVKMNYINSKVFPSRAKSVHEFLSKMNLGNVREERGDISVTSVATLLDTVLTKTGNNEMSIFVSDCVISPGNETNAVNVLNAEENYIATMFASVLRKRDLAVLIYRMSSDFSGNYYDSNNVAHYQNGGSRPYFIWLIGNKNIISRYKKKVFNRELAQNMSIKNSCEFYRVKKNPKYKILGGAGNYKVSQNGLYVTDAKFDQQMKEFSVNIYVNYKELLSSNSYLCNPQNYSVSNNNYKVKITKKAKAGYTHIIKLSTNRRPLSASRITIKLKNQLPKWLEQYSTEDCSSVVEQNDKTFGFYSIVKGLQQAYNFNGLPYATIKVEINTDIKN